MFYAGDRRLRICPPLILVSVLGLNGCAAIGGTALLTAGVGNATASGIERSFDGAIIKTVTEISGTVANAAELALDRMGFIPHNTNTDGNVTTIKAKSTNREVSIRVTEIAGNTTRIRIDVDRGYIFSQDSSTATEMMIQIEKSLETMRKASR